MPAELEGLPATLGRYELRALLGYGGMGRVIRAHDPVLRRDVALKLVEPRNLQPEQISELKFMFHREARAIAALRHSNIIEIYDYSGPHADTPFLACELIEGRVLGSVIDNDGPLRPALAAAVGYELSAALAHAHGQNIVHRDLKPDNVFWQNSGRIVLADFGIAKSMNNTLLLGATLQIDATHLYGSPAYMAPEQLNGGEIGAHSDLFALGTLLYELLTATPAFSGATVDSIITQVKAGAAPALPATLDCPHSLRDLVHQLLAADPKARPENARAVMTRLRAILDELKINDPREALSDFGGTTQTKNKAPVANGGRRPRKRLVPLSFAVFAAFAFIGWWTLRPSSIILVETRLILDTDTFIAVDGTAHGSYGGNTVLLLTPGPHSLKLKRNNREQEHAVYIVPTSHPVFDFRPLP